MISDMLWDSNGVVCYDGIMWRISIHSWWLKKQWEKERKVLGPIIPFKAHWQSSNFLSLGHTS
jgi:hypothetical protein